MNNTLNSSQTEAKKLIQNKSLEDTLQSLLNLPPFQLPPICKTRSGKYLVDVTIGELEICISGDSWQDVLTKFEIAIAAAQPMPAFQNLFYKNGEKPQPKFP